MDLIRKILFKIEEVVDNTVKYDLQIEGYTMEQTAYHCSLLKDSRLISAYEASYGDGAIDYFVVGRLTSEGHELLDSIKSDTVWNKTKETIKSKGLPTALDVIKDVSTAIITTATQAAIKGILGQ